MAEKSHRKQRLTRDVWLRVGLDVACSEGEAEMRIEKLCARLGVTKGSFYGHFDNRGDFIRQLMDLWSKEFTESVPVAMETFAGEPAEARLLALMRLLVEKRRLSRDLAFRTWATHDAVVARGVEQVDAIRLEYCRSIFHDIGFRGDELEMRTRTFLTYEASAIDMRFPPSGLNANEELLLRHAFFTRA